MVWILLGIVILLIIIFLSRIYVRCDFLLRQNKQKLFVTVSIFHIRIYKREIKLTGKGTEVNMFKDISIDSFTSKLKDALHILKQSGSVASLLLNRLTIHQLKWLTKGGTGDACTTGIASGILWAIKGALVGIVVEKANLKCEPAIDVTPSFQYKYMESKMDCIVSIRVGQAMYAFLKGMRLFSPKNRAYV